MIEEGQDSSNGFGDGTKLLALLRILVLGNGLPQMQ